MKPITIWERGKKDPDTKEVAFSHNHISNGFPDGFKPVPVNDDQAKSWAGGIWRSTPAYLCVSKVVHM